MTIAVDLGRKATKQNTISVNSLDHDQARQFYFFIFFFSLSKDNRPFNLENFNIFRHTASFKTEF